MGGNTVTVTDALFDDDVLRADRRVVVEFWAEWCMPCRLIAPVLEEIAVVWGSGAAAVPAATVMDDIVHVCRGWV